MTVTWAGVPAPSSKDWIAIVPINASDRSYVAWAYTNGAAASRMAFVLPLTIAAGTYDVRLFSNDTFSRIALGSVITIAASGPTLAATPITATVGTSVSATWTAIAAPTSLDWVGLYPVGAPDTGYVTRVYTDGTASGSGMVPLPANLPAGVYELRLFTNDTLTRLCVSNTFTAVP